MTKLIVQIPCFNEEQNIAQTIQSIPRAIKGISSVEILVIDDGSTDNTIDRAKAAGADHILPLNINHGLARAFSKGIDECLRLNADIIVNFDGDNQYKGKDIESLITPIIDNQADMVLGVRKISISENYTPLKIALHNIGTRVIRMLTNYKHLSDPVTGFRALSKETAMQVNIFSTFSYTTETLIAAANQKKRIVEVVIDTNKTDRPSRLFKSIPTFILYTAITIIRTYAMYKPTRFFGSLGIAFSISGLIPIARFLILFLLFGESGKIQSLILGGSLFLVGMFFFTTAILADISAHNRRLSEKILLELKKRG